METFFLSKSYKLLSVHFNKYIYNSSYDMITSFSDSYHNISEIFYVDKHILMSVRNKSSKYKLVIRDCHTFKIISSIPIPSKINSNAITNTATEIIFGIYKTVYKL